MPELGPSSIMRHFNYDAYDDGLHPKHLRLIKPICELARSVDESLNPSAEKATILRKLLEAKDAAIRAVDEDLDLV